MADLMLAVGAIVAILAVLAVLEQIFMHGREDRG
jgi:hypothetical protein